MATYMKKKTPIAKGVGATVTATNRKTGETTTKNKTLASGKMMKTATKRATTTAASFASAARKPVNNTKKLYK